MNIIHFTIQDDEVWKRLEAAHQNSGITTRAEFLRWFLKKHLPPVDQAQQS
jgi:hypothetical protein